MGKVVYLTGAPASGKSSTTRLLAASVPGLLVWEYGEQLTEHVKRRSSQVVVQDDLRQQSAAIVTSKDVEEVDEALIAFIERHRDAHSIIIDSHPVTKEAFGFRITPFSQAQFARLNPDEIWLLYASPEVTIQRIRNDPAGRPLISEEEARFHTALQAGVAANYGIVMGRAVHLFDSGGERDVLLQRLRGRLG